MMHLYQILQIKPTPIFPTIKVTNKQYTMNFFMVIQKCQIPVIKFTHNTRLQKLSHPLQKSIDSFYPFDLSFQLFKHQLNQQDQGQQTNSIHNYRITIQRELPILYLKENQTKMTTNPVLKKLQADKSTILLILILTSLAQKLFSYSMARKTKLSTDYIVSYSFKLTTYINKIKYHTYPLPTPFKGSPKTGLPTKQAPLNLKELRQHIHNFYQV
eukprot:TRINITY_DN1715_c0_g1_i17.p3 TRINITY_DN1715_c0_g1~~TRINITY_DN1715_c0_g1_i17.p3  ORF type:complete len:214 (-),score=-14.47 TRINITY_DN1715_c0_g1_i17:3350-3991(-)